MKVTFRVDYTPDETAGNIHRNECPEAAKILMAVDLSSDSPHLAITSVYERFLRAMGYHFKDGLYRGGE